MIDRRIGAAAFAVLLGGCSVGHVFDSEPKPQKAFLVGDEPYAVRAAATLMDQGGNAADAAAAMYFALAVTYPVSAGLGGGGICLVHDPRSQANEEFDFLARSAASNGPFAVPGSVRGIAMMQTRYGALPWQRVISPAEGLANTGFKISKALAERLSAASDVIRLDAPLAAEFLDESGKVKEAGSSVSNPDLGMTLAAIRVQGSGALYAGAIAQRIADYTASQGGAITAAELGAYQAQYSDPLVLSMGATSVVLPGVKTGAGLFAGKLLTEILRAEQQGATNTEAAVVEGTKRALASFAVSGLPRDLGATGFAVTDNSGLAVACAMTMNGPFGSGHTVPATGLTLARAPSSNTAGLAAAFLTPVLAIDSDGDLALAGAGAGGPVGTASIADALARLSRGEVVTQRGRSEPGSVELYDTVNAILCQGGVCTALPDASASGMGSAP